MLIRHCNVQISQIKREVKEHGTAEFPIGLYYDNLPFDDVPWHWHEHLELGYIDSGMLCFGVNSEKIQIPAGEGFFVNKEILHSCWCENKNTCTLHSLVFDTDLIGEPNSVFSGDI